MDAPSLTSSSWSRRLPLKFQIPACALIVNTPANRLLSFADRNLPGGPASSCISRDRPSAILRGRCQREFEREAALCSFVRECRTVLSDRSCTQRYVWSCSSPADSYDQGAERSDNSKAPDRGHRRVRLPGGRRSARRQSQIPWGPGSGAVSLQAGRRDTGARRQRETVGAPLRQPLKGSAVTSLKTRV